MKIPPQLIAWWNERESREQKMLLGGGVFAVLAILYALIYPVFATHSAASKAFQTADGDYRWLQEQVHTLAGIRAETGGALPIFLPPDEVRKKVESDLEKKAIKGQVVVEGAGDAKLIQVKIESGDGKKIMRWFEELSNSGYTVSALSLRNKDGRLSGDFSIEI